MARRKNIWNNIDWITIIIYLVLVFFGWINIYAAVYNEEHQSIMDFSQRYGKQLIWIAASIFLIILIFVIDSKFYSFFSYFIYGLSILLLIVVLIFGKEVHGAKSWIEIGPLRFQPSEFTKFATNMALAHFLSSYNVSLKKFKDLIIALIIIFIPAFLILFQNDTGSALVYSVFIIVLYREGLSANLLFMGLLIVLLFVLSLVINKLIIIIALLVLAFVVYYFVTLRRSLFFRTLITSLIILSIVIWLNYFYEAGIQNYYVIIISIVLSGLIYGVYAYRYKLRNSFIVFIILIGSIAFTFSVDYFFNNILGEHQRKRINILLGPETDPLGIGYNVNQSKIAIGSGGFSGKGFLQGTQTKYDFVPEQSTDFIFCTVGEEWGFIGTFIVIALFSFLLIRLVILAERQRSGYSRMYGYGVVGILFFHFLINIGMTIGITPVIGIPLPFFSYGGSSLWAFTILLFIFLKLDSSRFDLLW